MSSGTCERLAITSSMGLSAQVGAFERRVHLVDVGLVVLVVMHPHGGLVDVGLERRVVIGKGWDVVCHVSPCSRFLSVERTLCGAVWTFCEHVFVCTPGSGSSRGLATRRARFQSTARWLARPGFRVRRSAASAVSTMPAGRRWPHVRGAGRAGRSPWFSDSDYASCLASTSATAMSRVGKDVPLAPVSRHGVSRGSSTTPGRFSPAASPGIGSLSRALVRADHDSNVLQPAPPVSFPAATRPGKKHERPSC